MFLKKHKKQKSTQFSTDVYQYNREKWRIIFYDAFILTLIAFNTAMFFYIFTPFIFFFSLIANIIFFSLIQDFYPFLDFYITKPSFFKNKTITCYKCDSKKIFIEEKSSKNKQLRCVCKSCSTTLFQFNKYDQDTYLIHDQIAHQKAFS